MEQSPWMLLWLVTLDYPKRSHPWQSKSEPTCDQFKKTTLGGNKIDAQVFKRYYKLNLFRKSDLNLQGYVDTDLASDSDTRKSTTRYLYMINGTTVS